MLELNNVRIEDCDTGIKAEGLVNINASNLDFKNNNRDMSFMVEKNSNIVIQNMITEGCKNESITYKEYKNAFEKAKELVNTKECNLNKDEIEKLEEILNQLKKEKGNEYQTKKLLEEIYTVSKATTAGVIINLISYQLGLT